MDVGESVGADGGLLVGRRDMDGTNDGIVLGCNDGLLESSWDMDDFNDNESVGATGDWSGSTAIDNIVDNTEGIHVVIAVATIEVGFEEGRVEGLMGSSGHSPRSWSI